MAGAASELAVAAIRLAEVGAVAAGSTSLLPLVLPPDAFAKKDVMLACPTKEALGGGIVFLSKDAAPSVNPASALHPVKRSASTSVRQRRRILGE